MNELMIYRYTFLIYIYEMSLGAYIITHSNTFLGWDIGMQPMTCRFYLHFIHEEFFEFLKQDSCSVVLGSDLINILETNLLLFGGIIYSYRPQR